MLTVSLSGASWYTDDVQPEDQHPADDEREPEPLAEADDGMAPLITNTGTETPDDDADAATG